MKTIRLIPRHSTLILIALSLYYSGYIRVRSYWLSSTSFLKTRKSTVFGNSCHRHGFSRGLHRNSKLRHFAFFGLVDIDRNVAMYERTREIVEKSLSEAIIPQRTIDN